MKDLDLGRLLRLGGDAGGDAGCVFAACGVAVATWWPLSTTSARAFAFTPRLTHFIDRTVCALLLSGLICKNREPRAVETSSKTEL